jgi:hypothetical protein
MCMGDLVSSENIEGDRWKFLPMLAGEVGGRGQFLTCGEGQCAKVNRKPPNRNYARF